MSVILDEVFKMVLESSQLRKDGCHFSRFNSISDVMKMIHVKLLNSSDKEPEQINSNYLDPSKSNRGVCHKCSTKAFKIELNIGNNFNLII